MNNDYKLDIIVNNTVELPKAAKAENVVTDIKYEVDEIKAFVIGSILDVYAKLTINIMYKSVDHTIRWNEQVIEVCGSKILDESCNEVQCKCIKVRTMSSNIIYPNVYCQKILLQFSIEKVL